MEEERKFELELRFLVDRAIETDGVVALQARRKHIPLRLLGELPVKNRRARMPYKRASRRLGYTSQVNPILAVSIFQGLFQQPQAISPRAQLRRDLPDDAGVVLSALRGCAVEITIRVNHHVADRISPVAAASKAVHRGVSPSVVYVC